MNTEEKLAERAVRLAARLEEGCTCAQIMLDDDTRHFRGCPLREKYPTHEAETHVRREDADRFLKQYDELMLAIDDAGFTVASGKLERKTHNIEFPSMKKTPIEERFCGGQFRTQACGDARSNGYALQCDKCSMWAFAGVREGDQHKRAPAVREEKEPIRWTPKQLIEAIDRAGFRLSKNMAHPFLGPTEEDQLTLWCKECGRDSGYHYPSCSAGKKLAEDWDYGVKAEAAYERCGAHGCTLKLGHPGLCGSYMMRDGRDMAPVLRPEAYVNPGCPTHGSGMRIGPVTTDLGGGLQWTTEAKCTCGPVRGNAWSSREDAPPGAVELKMPENTVFTHDLEKHRREIHSMLNSRGITDNMVSEAIWFLLAVVHQPDVLPSNLAGRLDALEKAMILTQGYVCMTCGDGDVKPGCIANHDVRPHDVVKQLIERVEKLENTYGVESFRALMARVDTLEAGRYGAIKNLDTAVFGLETGLIKRVEKLEDLPRRVIQWEVVPYDLRKRIEKLEKEAQEFQPWRIGESPVGLLRRIEELEDTVTHDFDALRSRGDVHDDRLKKLEQEVADIPIRRGPMTSAELKKVLGYDGLWPQAQRVPEGNVGPVDPDIIKKTSQHTWMTKIRREIPFEHDRPRIVTLCGSTRFGKAFADANLSETLAGRIVLSVGSMTHSDAELKITDEQKKALDALHLKKVEMADEVFCLNVLYCKECGSQSYPNPEFLKRFKGGELKMTFSHGAHTCDHQPYIGESTKSEIVHAYKLGKRIRFLNPQGRAGTTLLTHGSEHAADGLEELLFGSGNTLIAEAECSDGEGHYYPDAGKKCVRCGKERA